MTAEKNDRLEKIRHSTSHLLAYAVRELFDGVKFAIGPTIENGFYYDFDMGGRTFAPEDLKKIETKMSELIKQKLLFEKTELTIKEAQKKMTNQPYKLELIKDLAAAGESQVSFYTVGDFADLCRGPHAENTKELGIFKLMKIAGAYWKGSEKNKMLQRIYGTAFETKDELAQYLKMLEEAEKRDHRKLGKELGLFIFSDLVGPGLPIYTGKGAILRREIINFSNDLQKGIGYEEVHTPNMNKAELFKVSGHYDKYKDGMFKVISNYSEEEYFLKPMNCPHHTQIFASQSRSYKDLPIRIADFANLYRDEKPGELSGLTRLRCFAQDDGHCFCREDQIKEEFLNVLGIINQALKAYGMAYSVRLSLWDPEHCEKYLGEPEVWERSQELLKQILSENKIEHEVGIGEAAIYGPKMDLISKDSLGREWQISTIQLDFIMPQRFGLKYTDAEGKEKTPVMIHRAIVGSPERFMGILIEHYAGAFPLWLSPVQAVIIPVSEKFNDYGGKVFGEIKEAGIRVEIDQTDESLGKRIRNAEKQKTPYILVVGEKEVEAKTVAIRKRGEGDLGAKKIKEFIEEIKKEIKEKK